MNLVVWALPIWLRLASSHIDCFSFPHCLYDLKLSCIWGKLLAMFHIFLLAILCLPIQVFQDPNHRKNNTYNTFFFWTLVTLIQAPVHFVYIVVRIVTICACSILINGIFSKHVWCGSVCNLAQREITEKYTFFQHDMVLKWDSTTKLKCVGISHCRWQVSIFIKGD